MTSPPVTPASPCRAARRRSRNSWVLPDDGIVDEIAMAIAAAGTRPVALTRTERRLAAERILASGGTPYLISRRLHVSGQTALALAAAIRSAQDGGASGAIPLPVPDREAA